MLRFALVGCANTLFGFAVIMAVGWLLQLGDVAANAIGYGCGLVLSFVLNRRTPFATRGVPPARWFDTSWRSRCRMG